METEIIKRPIDDAFKEIFARSTSATGEEEMLRIASIYSRQITSPQIRLLLFLEHITNYMGDLQRNAIRDFIKRWLELKQYNNSAGFVMRALESISLRKFINENSMKVNIEK